MLNQKIKKSYEYEVFCFGFLIVSGSLKSILENVYFFYLLSTLNFIYNLKYVCT